MPTERISKSLIVDNSKAPLLVVRVRRSWFDVSTLLLALGALALGYWVPAWGVAVACLLLVKLGVLALGQMWFIEMEFDPVAQRFQAVRRTPFGRWPMVSVPYAALAIVPINGTRPRWALKAGVQYVRLGQREDACALIARARLHTVLGAAQLERHSKPRKTSH